MYIHKTTLANQDCQLLLRAIIKRVARVEVSGYYDCISVEVCVGGLRHSVRTNEGLPMLTDTIRQHLLDVIENR